VDGDSVGYDRVEGVKSLCNKLKAAWTSKQRRKKNTNKTETAFTISNKARSQLEKLAKNQNCSFSQVVESLVLSSKEISALERNLAKALDSESDKKKSKISLFQSMLKKQNDLSNLEEQLLQLQKQNEELAKRLSALGNDNCALTKKVADYEHEIHDLRLEAEQLQAGLENNTSGANCHHSPKEDLSQNYPDLTQDKNSTDEAHLDSEQQGPMLRSAWEALKANSD
jgi:chromosome segregation ATPase